MKRRFLYITLSFLVAGVLQSCVSIKNYQMDILVPATVSIPPDIKSVIVIDNAKLPGDSIEIVVSDHKGQYIKPNTDTIPAIALKQLYETIRQRSFFDTVYLQPITSSLARSQSIGSSNLKKTLTEAKNNHQADAAVVLEEVKLFPKLDYQPFYTETLNYRIDQSFVANFVWVIVDLKHDSVLDVYNQVDTLVWTSYANALAYPVIGLPSFNESVRSVADYFGYYCADRICPNWVRENRYYFAGNGMGWDLANASIAKNDWLNAAKVWFGMYSSSKGAPKARLAHNIALSYEVLGDFEEAVKWSAHSKLLFKPTSSWFVQEKALTDDYYNTILKRALHAKKLAEQLGG
jgi:hypothetical protein